MVTLDTQAPPTDGASRSMAAVEVTPAPPGTKILERRLVLPASRAEVFAFFSNAENLGLITPPALGFEIVSPIPAPMRVGALIDYRIRLHGIPMRWRTRIELWDPPHRFVDLQLRGPYRLWVHHHEFRQVAEGTEIRDRVRYRLPVLGGWSGLVRRMVRQQLDAIFDYRTTAVQQYFAVEASR